MTPPTLVTERLTLRPMQEADFPHAAAMWGDADVTRFIGGAIRPPQDVWFAMLRGRAMWDIKGFGFWVVTDTATGAFLGEAGFADFKRGMDPDLSQWPEAGWAFGKPAWGKGIASEVIAATHAWLDSVRPGDSVCIIDDENAASRRVAEKSGYGFWQTSELRGKPINVYRRSAA